MSAEFAISISIVPLLAAGLVTPGYIIMYMLSRFTTGRPSFASSLAVSSAYYVGVWAVFDLGSVVDVAQRIRALDIDHWAALTVVVAPLGIGVLAGVSVQRGWLYDALRMVGLEPVHGIPSAWDWKFMRAKDQWITVHLKDGTPLVAHYRHDCFVSTDPDERDLYLSNVHLWQEGTLVENDRIEGLLLKGDCIDRIEFHENHSQADEPPDIETDRKRN